jgi:hypothetical protein
MKKKILTLIGLTTIAVGVVTAQEMLQAGSPPLASTFHATLTVTEAKQALSSLSSVVQLPTGVSSASVKFVSVKILADGSARVTVVTDKPAQQ